MCKTIPPSKNGPVPLRAGPRGLELCDRAHTHGITTPHHDMRGDPGMAPPPFGNTRIRPNVDTLYSGGPRHDTVSAKPSVPVRVVG